MIEVAGTAEGFQFKGNLTHIFIASSARDKCKTHHCTIILVNIIEGKITKREKIEIVINNEKRMDTVCRIEKNKQEVPFAQAGEKVGICLDEVMPKDFGLIEPSL